MTVDFFNPIWIAVTGDDGDWVQTIYQDRLELVYDAVFEAIRPSKIIYLHPEGPPKYVTKEVASIVLDVCLRAIGGYDLDEDHIPDFCYEILGDAEAFARLKAEVSRRAAAEATEATE